MAKPELGTKRLCSGCGAKYYDLNRDPITCPKCGTIFVLEAAVRPAKASKKAVVEDEEVEEEVEGAEIVSLEEADAEADDDVTVDGDDGDDVEVDSDLGDDDDVFIEEDDDEGDVGIAVERDDDDTDR